MTGGRDVKGEGAKASYRARFLLTGALLFLCAIFVALGTWQIQRLFWKLDLIDRVDARVHADAVPAPSRPDWGGILQFLDRDGHVADGYVPVFNALNIFRVPQLHNVSSVVPFAGHARLSITGWFRR